jgi:hypothetical protein
MDSSYRITPHPERCMMEVTVTGLFQHDKVQRFASEKRAAVESLKCAPNHHLTLIDVSACEAQSENLVSMLHSVIADPRYRARRIAFVVGESPFVDQLRRILNGRDAMYFQDHDSAEAWLFAG